jgi:ubiquinone/menaquinone biosynthesis C-methylase UbiE
MKPDGASPKDRAYYDAAVPYFEDLRRQYLLDTRWKRNRVRNVLRLARPQPGDMVLDLGCGIGTFTFESALKGAWACGTDFSVTALAAARRIASEKNLPFGGLAAADVARLPFKKESFTLIICADLVEHLYEETYRQMLSECRRILAPGGRLAIYTPSPTHLFERLQRQGILKQDESHIGLKTMPYLLQTLREGGFSIPRHYFRPTHLPLYRWMESLAMPIPGLGPLFRRRCCVLAVK